MEISRLVNNIIIVGKHLEKNERYFNYPTKKVIPTMKAIEEQMHSFEKEINSWSYYLD